MNALVTGSHGFAGTHLRRVLAERGWNVAGVDREAREPGPDETYHRVDLLDRKALRRAVDEAAPDVVIHLAALWGRGGEEETARTWDVNVGGTANLFAALLDRGRPVRVIVAGSSAQYGAVPPEDDPVDESAPQNPLGVYGWSKVAAEAVAMAHHGRGGIEVVRVRPFNHTGPGEPEHLVCSGFARQIARIEAGEDPVMRVGDLATVRDLTDVRDIARGYVDLAENGAPGEVYNLCSGRGTRVEDVLGMLLDRTSVTVEVRADPARLRAAELPRQVGSARRAERAVGWKAEIPLERSLGDLLEEWRERVGVSGAKRSGA